MAVASDSESNESDYSDIDQREEEEDSDRELQRKFASGELLPGIYGLSKRPVKKYKNDVAGLKKKMSEFRLKLPWIERFDITISEAPLAPELDAEIVEHGQTRERRMRSQQKGFNLGDDPIHNDFKREMSFYRQAQAAVLDGYSRLTALSLPTNRPEDYFAQMTKSDEHMQKVRKRLLNKQVGQQISERVKKIREIKKYGKKVQIEVEQQKHKDKREMLDKIKKFRKGKAESIDFLEDKGSLRNKKAKGKRSHKNEKFGFGGKKKNLKRNTSNSCADGSMPPMRRPGAQQGGKGGKGNQAKGNRNKKTKSRRTR